MPVIVKPRGLGSSLGVSFASNVEELVEALNHARGFSEWFRQRGRQCDVPWRLHPCNFRVLRGHEKALSGL